MAFVKSEKPLAERAKADNAVFGDRVPYFSVEDGKVVWLRLLTSHEDWLMVAQHNGVKTKPAPPVKKKKDGEKEKDAPKWPSRMSAICKKDPQLTDDPKSTPCYICDNRLPGFQDKYAKPSARVWALAVERVEVKGDGSKELGGEAMNGKRVGFGDATEEYVILDEDGEPTGETDVRPKFVLINMSWSNFFAHLHAASEIYGTVQDRDFAVRREGVGLDTDYHIMNMDATPTLKPGTESWQRYTDEIARRGDNADLVAIVTRMASDEHYARFFDPRFEINDKGEVVPASTKSSGASAAGFDATEADEGGEVSSDVRDRLLAMKSRTTA
jgi:hypothetical protein